MTIEQLARLNEAATAGPCELIDERHVCVIRVGDAYMQAPYQPPNGRGRCARQRADGAVFVAARNHLPQFIELARAARKLLDAPGFSNAYEMHKLSEALAKLENVT